MCKIVNRINVRGGVEVGQLDYGMTGIQFQRIVYRISEQSMSISGVDFEICFSTAASLRLTKNVRCPSML